MLVRDAEDAVYARDGYDYDGYRLRVEFPKGGGGSFRGGRGAGGGRGDDKLIHQDLLSIVKADILFCA